MHLTCCCWLISEANAAAADRGSNRAPDGTSASPLSAHPSNSTARGLLEANWRRVPLAISAYTSAARFCQAVKMAAVDVEHAGAAGPVTMSNHITAGTLGRLQRGATDCACLQCWLLAWVQQRQQQGVLYLPLLVFVASQDAPVHILMRIVHKHLQQQE